MHTRGLWAREETEVNYLENSERENSAEKNIQPPAMDPIVCSFSIVQERHRHEYLRLFC